MPESQRHAVADGSSPESRPERRMAERFEEEIDLGRYLRPLARRWPLLVVGALVGALAGYVVSLRRPILYEASTTLLVQQAGSPTAVATSRALFRNVTLAAETIKETGLDQPPLRLSPQAFVDSVLAVEEVPGTMLLRIKARLSDPELAAKASQVISTKAVALNRRVVVEGNTAVRDQLRVLLDDAAARLKKTEEDLVQRRSQAQIELLQKDAAVMLDERETLLKLRIDIEVEKSRLAAAEREIAKQPPLLSAPRAVESEAALRRIVEEERAGARRPSPVDAKPDVAEDLQKAPLADPQRLDLSQPFVNPVYQTLAFQIATSRTRLAGMERERRELVAVRNPAASRDKELADLYRGEIDLQRLQNEYDLARRVFNDLTVRYEQSRSESVGTMVQLQIVDRAFPPERPMPRKRVETSIVGLTAGVFLAALLALAISRDPDHGSVSVTRPA